MKAKDNFCPNPLMSEQTTNGADSQHAAIVPPHQTRDMFLLDLYVYAQNAIPMLFFVCLQLFQSWKKVFYSGGNKPRGIIFSFYAYSPYIFELWLILLHVETKLYGLTSDPLTFNTPTKH